MKKNWPVKTLGEVCCFDKQQEVHGNLPYVGMEHIESKTARFVGSLDAQAVKSSTFRFSPEHVLYGRLRPYLNKVLAPDFEGHCSTEIFPLKPSRELSREYLLCWLLSDETCDRINATCTGARMPRANMKEVLTFSFPIPPLEEQRRIVGVLDEAFEGMATAKANAEQNLQNARALFESHLNNVFADAWKNSGVVTLSDLATDITDGDHMPPPKSSTGVPFITIRNIVKETREIDFSDTFMVPRSYFDALKPYKKPRRRDVLYTVTGSYGIPVIVRDDVEFCFQRHIGLVRPKPETNSSWLYYLLMSPQLLKQANNGATGTAQKTVSLKLLRGFEVPRVSPKQQKQAVEKLDVFCEETQRLASIYERKVELLEELKKSLLQRAFNGEL